MVIRVLSWSRATGQLDKLCTTYWPIVVGFMRKHAHDTAASYGLHDRGLLAPGKKADINIIDFDYAYWHTVDEIVIGEGPYAAAMGSVTATHAGEFLGAEATGKKINLKYMDFWKVEDGKIVENWVLIDVVDFFRQIGIDLLDGKGWDDRGREVLEQDTGA